jgi:hypothetical protein
MCRRNPATPDASRGTFEHLSYVISNRKQLGSINQNSCAREKGEHARPRVSCPASRRAQASPGFECKWYEGPKRKLSLTSQRPPPSSQPPHGRSRPAGTPDNHTRGRVCSPIPIAPALMVTEICGREPRWTSRSEHPNVSGARETSGDGPARACQLSHGRSKNGANVPETWQRGLEKTSLPSKRRHAENERNPTP